jgi:hypothetical protein
MKKNIEIEGIRHRYWMKKVIDPEDALKPKYKKKGKVLSPREQLQNVTDISKESKESIVNKINGYKQQDILKRRLDVNNFIDFEFVHKMLIDSKLHCHYCQETVLIIYDIVREMKQWSLDRIDNTIGHNKQNVLVCCLECNLKRRNKSTDSFLFTKRLIVEKR